MRRFLCRLLAAAAAFLSAAVRVPPCAAETNTLTTVLAAPVLDIETDAGGMQRLSVTDSGVHAAPGAPLLPQRVFRIGIPPDAVVKDIRFSGEETLLPGHFSVEPVSMVLPTRPLQGEDHTRALEDWRRTNASFYGSKAFYPPVRARSLGVGSFGCYRFVTIQWFPWRFSPGTGQMQMTPKLSVEIDWFVTPDAALAGTRARTVIEDEAGKLLVNADEAFAWYRTAETSCVESSGYGLYLVLCHPDDADDVETLVNWKRSIGYDVRVILLTDFINDPIYSTHDLPGKIRAYLRDHYLPSAPAYLLIVGDHTRIPMRDCVVYTPQGDPRFPYTDQYYGELSLPDSQSWDANGNGDYGEHLVDPVDWVMELYVGRLALNDPAQIRAYCDMVRDFEMDTGSWKQRVLFNTALLDCTGMDDRPGVPFTDGAFIATSLINGGTFSNWYVRRGVEREGEEVSSQPFDFALSSSTVEAEWGGTDYGLVNFAGHGSPAGPLRLVWTNDVDGNGMAGHGEYIKPFMFERGRIAQVISSEPSVVYLCGCNNGRWDDPDAIAKAMLRGAAVGTIGSTMDSFHYTGWESPSDGGGDQGMQVLWNREVNVFPDIGRALAAAKAAYWTTYLVDYGTTAFLQMGNLYGDPGVNINGVAERPNLRPYHPPGWGDTVMPRSSADATPTWCPVPSILHGNAETTWFNFGIENNGDVATYAAYSRIYVDGEYLVYARKDCMAAGEQATARNMGPYSVKGGRHTVRLYCDPLATCTESNELDNDTWAQYVWSPDVLTPGVSVRRSAPPVRGESFFNCDGFEASLGSGGGLASYWCAAGIVPHDPRDNYDIRIYHDYVDSINGFDTYHKWSDAGGDATDFCIVNRRQTGSAGPYYFGVIRSGGGHDGYTLCQHNATPALGVPWNGGPFLMGYQSVVRMHDLYIQEPGYYHIRLEDTSAWPNLGISLYDAGVGRFARDDHMPGGYADQRPRGEDERICVRIYDEGGYGLAVWKTDSAGHGMPCLYHLRIFGDDPYEWNNSLPQAWHPGYPWQGTWLSEMEGTGVQADDDWYLIEATGTDLRILAECTFTNAKGNVDLALYDENATRLALADSTTDDEIIDCIVSNAGTYYLWVGNADEGSVYDLWWDDRPTTTRIDDNYEENDVPIAGFTGLGQQTWLSSVDGFGRLWDQDWYLLSLGNFDAKLVVTCLCSHAAADLRLELRNAQGELVASVNSATDNEILEYLIPQMGGAYYLLVDGANVGSEYDLWWNAGPPTDDFYEENDTPQTSWMTFGERMWLTDLKGQGIQADDDWYRIAVPNDRRHVVVTCRFDHASGDIDVALHDAQGQLLTRSSSATDNEVLEYSVTGGGDYLVRVGSADAGNMYDLRWDAMVSSPFPYELMVNGGFECGDFTAWTTDAAAGTNPFPRVQTDTLIDGAWAAAMAGVGASGEAARASQTIVISPEASIAALSLSYRIDGPPGGSGGLYVYVDETEVARRDTDSSGWQPLDVDLTSYIGSTVTVGIAGACGQAGEALASYVDSVSVRCDARPPFVIKGIDADRSLPRARLYWQAQPSESYDVWWTGSLGGEWPTSTPVTAGADFYDDTSVPVQRSYRLSREPP